MNASHHFVQVFVLLVALFAGWIGKVSGQATDPAMISVSGDAVREQVEDGLLVFRDIPFATWPVGEPR